MRITICYIPLGIKIFPTKRLDAVILAVTAIGLIKPGFVLNSKRLRLSEVNTAIQELQNQELKSLLHHLLNEYK